MNPDDLICIYHANCPDGFSAAWAVWKKFGDAVTYWPAHHNEPPPWDLIKGKDVVMCDFAYPKDLMIEITGAAESVIVLDHHETAEAIIKPMMAQGWVEGEFDMDRCGSMITWEYFHDDPPPPMLLYIQDRDLWQWEMKHSREINEYVLSHEYTFPVWDELMGHTDFENCYLEGRAIRRKKIRDLKELIPATIQPLSYWGKYGAFCNLPYTLGSDGCDLMLQAMPELDWAGYWWMNDKREYKFGLRSRDAEVFSVSKMASRFGGGGHGKAAGFTLSERGFKKLWGS